MKLTKFSLNTNQAKRRSQLYVKWPLSYMNETIPSFLFNAPGKKAILLIHKCFKEVELLFPELKRAILEYWHDPSVDERSVLGFIGHGLVGNKNLHQERFLKVTHYRVTYGNDHVPHFPLASMGWKHFGNEI
ncbi:hypothetical protein G9A89_007590 [Geosiphon pyriformis]|nr:hypothetical protein G9A89_007590 [Geosiphon pyriformis]